MNILIGGARVYANGSLHIGHAASLLPGDVLARYHRQKGDRVCYVSGSDCHGTPITNKAIKEDKSPEEISDRYHQTFIEGFSYLGFSYDCYDKTSSDYHKAFVRDFHKQLYKTEYVYEKESHEPYCHKCQRFLPGRLVIGLCPFCGNPTKGDQCDSCNQLIQADSLVNIQCSTCLDEPEFIETKHLYLKLSALEPELKAYVDAHDLWRSNAISFTNRYISEGVRDRAITRDLAWGIDVPKKGFEDKKIYIWAENVLGYLSASKQWCESSGSNFEELWGDDSRHYYVHGKDNIPFHTIILPGLLLAHKSYQLPTDIVSSEYLTLDGQKISTSENWAVWIEDLIGKYNPDAIRYYLLAYGPEKRDADFAWREFSYVNNGELLGGYGNFINRTLVFIKKQYNGVLETSTIDKELEKKVEDLYEIVGSYIESGQFKKAVKVIFRLVKDANKYFDVKQPWVEIKTDQEACNHILYNCLYLIGNLANLLRPFLPFSSDKVLGWLNIKSQWKPIIIDENHILGEIEPLFERVEVGG